MAAARISILATPFGNVDNVGSPSLYAGQPISAELKIDTSFHWGPSRNDRDQRFMMRYNIEETIRDWLISGPKRGEFSAKVCIALCMKCNVLTFALFLGQWFVHNASHLAGVTSWRIDAS